MYIYKEKLLNYLYKNKKYKLLKPKIFINYNL